MRNPAVLEQPKRPTNLSVRADLLAEARRFGIHLSATLEAALVVAIKNHQSVQWRSEHETAIQALNAQVDELGVFSDGLRAF